MPLRILVCLAVFALLPHIASARDVYGNDTPWTNSDTIIWELHQKKFEPPAGFARPSWQSQLAAREEQKRYAAEQAARALVEARELKEWAAKRVPDVPLTWAQETERYILDNPNRSADESDALGFYYVRAGNLLKARRHLELVIFRKRPHAGAAAWQLYQLFKDDGPQPDAAKAAQYLNLSVDLGYHEGLWKLATARYQGDPARGIPPDPAGAVPMLTKLFDSTDASISSDAGRLLLAYDEQTPGREAHAIVVMRRLVGLAQNLRISDGAHFAGILIASPGGWEENHAEILAALKISPLDADTHDLLARVYLGLVPAAQPYVKRDDNAAAGALADLARTSPTQADALFAQILPAGPDQRLDAAEKLLAASYALDPEDVSRAQRYADFLADSETGRSDPAAALALYEKLAASPGASPAIIAATARLLSLDFVGHTADPIRAFSLFKRAADAGDPYSTYRYDRALFDGEGCPRDREAALNLLRDETHSTAPTAENYPLFALAARAMRESAPGDEWMLSEARNRASAPKNFPPAQLEYARCVYALSKLQKAADFNEDSARDAFRGLDLAARSGLDEARLLLARFYREGFGTTADISAAREIYEGGARAEVPIALAALAELKLDADSRFYNAAEGHALAVRAAGSGEPHGLFLLGRCLLRGEGVSADPVHGNEFLARAANSGDADARTLLADLRLSQSHPGTDAYAQSVRDLQQAAADGSLEAAIRLLQVLATNPDRSPERLKKLNLLALSQPYSPPAEDDALASDFADVTSAIDQVATLTGQRRDTTLTYETALWLLGEPTTFAPPTGFTFYQRDLFDAAAQDGHPGAQYHAALHEFEIAHGYMRDPEEDASALKSRDLKYSTDHLSEGLRFMRAAAAAGQPDAIAYLKNKNIPVEAPASDNGVDQPSLEKIDPAARGTRAEAEFFIARRAMRRAREYLAEPEEDERMLASTGQRYSDAYFEEALKYFRRAAAGDVPAAVAYLKKQNIPLIASDTGDEPDRASIAKLKAASPDGLL